MKVILLADVKGSGKKDQVIEVAEGYGRNYLIPRKLARLASADTLNAIEQAKAAAKHRDDVLRAEAEVKARALKGKIVQVQARGGENGKLYGSVTNEQIAAALKAQYGLDVDKRKVETEETLRTTGQAPLTVHLAAGVSVHMLVNVTVAAK